MGRGTVRAGTSIQGTTTSAGTDGDSTDPRVVTFDPYVRPVIVHNNTGNDNAIFVKLNATAATDFGGASDDGAGHFPINDGAAVEVSLGGLVDVGRISFVTAQGDDLDNVVVVGWRP